MKRNAFLAIAATLISLAMFSCTKRAPSDLTKISIIPRPLIVEASGEYFKIDRRMKIYVEEDIPGGERIAGEFADAIAAVSGLRPDVGTGKISGLRRKAGFVLHSGDMDPEAYSIQVDRRLLLVSAGSPAGLFRAVQTLRQMVLQGDGLVLEEGRILIPSGRITDRPEYGYRGIMLDVARHFFEPEVVKRLIDQVAMYKINFLHLHLSDDQGWRIEIKTWPDLTRIGGSTEVGGGEGGYYTQESYREIVEYAAERYITVVPEIDMPGHTNAALASYAELNCDGKARELYTGTRVGFSTLCTDKEITYRFVDDVIRELAALTPGPYIHIGGDESHVTAKDDYIYFINRVKQIVNDHGKQLIGWDEISHAAIGEGDVAQYWSSAENALRAVEKGARLIISPAQRCYLDMKYDSSTVIGLDWAGYTEVDDAYTWRPDSLVAGIGRKDIIGVESPLWGETIESAGDIEYLAFPRLIAHAEVGWCRGDSLEWEGFRERLGSHAGLLERAGINYYRSQKIEWKTD